MAAPSPTPDRWYYSHSSTLRSIYVLRYLLFAGGVAVAGGLLQRSLGSTGKPTLGLLVGLVVGMVVFIGQLRHAFAPRLALSREALYLVKRGQISKLPWKSVREVSRAGNCILLHLTEPISWESAKAVRDIRLNPRRLGTTAAKLHSSLRVLATDAGFREKLPSDAELRRRLEKGQSRT